MSTTSTDLSALADAFCSTDTHAICADVERLGGIEEAADYCADMAAGQPDYEALDSDDGREALAESIRAIVNA